MTADFCSQQAAARPPQQEMEELSAQLLQLAASHRQSGQIGLAKELYSSLLDILPSHPAANYHLGILEMQAHRPAGGIPHLEAALAACPEQEQYWLAYIDALTQTGQEDAARHFLELGLQHGLAGDAMEKLAERLKTHALATPQPEEKQQGIIEVNSVQGAVQPKAKKPTKASRKKTEKAPSVKEINAVVALYAQGKITEVEKLALSLTTRFPKHGFGWKLLAGVFKAKGQSEKALQAMQNSVKFLPEDAEAHSNLGNILQDQGRLGEAEVSLRRSLALKPDYAIGHYNLSTILQGQGRINEMEASLRRAIEINPDYADAHNNLGLTLQDQYRHNEAEISLRRALAVEPDSGERQSNLLFCLSQMEGIDTAVLFAEHCRFGQKFETPLITLRQDHQNPRDPERCLQVGFVSADLRNHAVASFIEPVLVYLAGHKTLSLHAYYNHATEDNATQRLQGYFAHWHSVFGISDAAMEKQIRADGIDILIDLSGHTAGNRLPVFARKPAPVQVSWIGYPGTTGLQAMDYYLTDRHLLPPGQFDHQFTEKLAYLPLSTPFLPSPDAPSVNTLPALVNGYITFGSFNRPNKLNPTVIALWSQLLRASPDARMLLGAMQEDGNNDTLIAWFAKEGIAQERLSFYPRSGMAAYLALHHQVDICLDTFPYTGGTTTLHALWMGVPTLTLAGNTAAGRQGACILELSGLAQFVAQDTADFVQKGLSITAQIDTLAKLRSGLRNPFALPSPSYMADIADGFESVLRTMWRRWCAGLPALTIDMSLQKNDDDRKKQVHEKIT